MAVPLWKCVLYLQCTYNFKYLSFNTNICSVCRYNICLWSTIFILWPPWGWVMVLSATFNNISAIFAAISFIGGRNRRKKHRPAASDWQAWSPPRYNWNIVESGVKRHKSNLAWAGLELATLVEIDTDSIGSCKPNWLTITTTTAPCDLHDTYVMYIFFSMFKHCRRNKTYK